MAPPRTATGTFHVDHVGPTTVVSLFGEHDIATAPELRRILLTRTPASTLVVDLRECAFLDGSIVGLLVGAHSRLVRHGRRLVATNASGQPERVLALVGSSLDFAVHRAESAQQPA